MDYIGIVLIMIYWSGMAMIGLAVTIALFVILIMFIMFIMLIMLIMLILSILFLLVEKGVVYVLVLIFFCAIYSLYSSVFYLYWLLLWLWLLFLWEPCICHFICLSICTKGIFFFTVAAVETAWWFVLALLIVEIKHPASGSSLYWTD